MMFKDSGIDFDVKFRNEFDVVMLVKRIVWYTMLYILLPQLVVCHNPLSTVTA
jgi:hypothetical protein